MANILRSEVLYGVLLLFFFQGCWSRIQPPSSGNCSSEDCALDISCMVIDMEYVNCRWNGLLMKDTHYNFSSAFEKGQFYKECPQYLQEQGHIVGCQIPLRNTEHFNYFSTKLSVDGRYSVSKNYSNLIKRVKLNTPYNLSLEWTPTSDLCLQWVNSYKKLRCMEFKVRYQRDSDPLQSYSVQSSTVYCIPLASKVVNYTFQVKSRIGQYCGTSDIWSEWSEPVQWGNSSEPLSLFSWQLCISISGCILLIVLGGLLCYCERVRILPVFPDPSKNLQDLFQKHNGNVESWVYVSRELKEAFEPDYTESSCLVYESTPTLKAIECDGPSQQQPSS